MAKFFTLLFIFLSVFAHAQRLPLEKSIHQLEQQFSTTVSFDQSLVENVLIDSIHFETLSEYFSYFKDNTAFLFNTIDSSNLILSPISKGHNLLLKGVLISESGQPVSNGYFNIPNQNINSFTDEKGNYRFYAKLNKIDSVSISDFVSFEIKKPISQWNTNTKVIIETPESSVLINTVIIDQYLTDGFQYNHEDQSIELQLNQLALIPGETEIDVLNSIQALPGINSPSGKTGELVSRGTDPDKNLITFDNIPIYHNGHYFGTFSPFNTDLIDRIKIQKNAGQGSNYGGRIGSVIEIKTNNQIVDSIQSSLSLGSSYFSANINIPLIKNKLSAILGFRKSYPTSFSSIKIDSINSFVFQESKIGASLSEKPNFELNDYSFNFYDLNAKIIYQPHPKHKLELTGLNIKNEMNLDVLDTRKNDQVLDTAQLSNWGINLRITNQWNNRFSSSTNITNSRYLEEINGLSQQNGQINSMDHFKNGSNDFSIKNTNIYKLNKNQKLAFGMESNFYDVSHYQYSFTTSNLGQDSIRSKTSNVQSLFFDYKKFRAFNFLSLSLGSRASYFEASNQFYLEPRMLANLHFTKNLTGKLNAGIYHQYITHIYGTRLNNLEGIKTINWQLTDGKKLPVIMSKQGSLGLIWNKNDWVIDVEGYYKENNNITSGNFFTGDSSFNLTHGGYSTFGLDLLIKKKIKNFESWVSYSYMDSEATFDSLEFVYIWNQKHLLNIVLGYHYKKFKITSGWKYVSGIRNDDVRLRFIAGTPTFSTGSGPSIPEPTNFVKGSAPEYGEYFPDNHQLDIAASYYFYANNNKLKFILGAAVTNIYDNRIIIYQTNRPVPGPPGSYIRVNKTGFGRMFNANIKVIWR